jgi:predicted P-loop ATPase
MVVLEGGQGELKTSMCRALAGDEYFGDSLPPIGGDQVRLSMYLHNKWLIEIAELSALTKTDVEPLKAFITRRAEDYIPKYGRKLVHEKRQCLFIGTTNDDEYNRDDTGGRRFWPVVVVKIDLDGFRASREQLFAEAVAAYRAHKPPYPDRDFETTVIAKIQAERQTDDAWTETVLKTANATITPENPSGGVTTMAIALALGFWSESRLDMLAQKRIGAILKKQGWRKFRWRGGGKIWRKS